MNDKDIELLKEMCEPLMRFLIDNHNPHTTIEITTDQVKVKQDMLDIPVGIIEGTDSNGKR